MRKISANSLNNCLTRISNEMPNMASAIQKIGSYQQIMTEVNNCMASAKPGMTVVVGIKSVKGLPSISYLVRKVQGNPAVVVRASAGDDVRDYVLGSASAECSASYLAQLAAAIAQGDENARNELVARNLGLAYKAAQRYTSDPELLNELVQEASIAMVDAANRYDAEVGPYSTYAYMCASSACKQFFTKNGRMVSLPKQKAMDEHDLKVAREILLKRLEREPMHDELAEYMGLENLQVAELLCIEGRHKSLDMPLGKNAEDDDEYTLGDVLAADDSYSPDAALMNSEMEPELLRQIKVVIGRTMAKSISKGRDINTLSREDKQKVSLKAERYTRMIKQWFGIGQDFDRDADAIAEQEQLTPERVRQVVRTWEPVVQDCYLAVINGEDLTLAS